MFNGHTLVMRRNDHSPFAERTRFLRQRYSNFSAVRYRPIGAAKSVETSSSPLVLQTLQRVHGLPLLVGEAQDDVTVNGALHELLGMRFANYSWHGYAFDGRRRIRFRHERAGIEDSAWHGLKAEARRAYRPLRAESIAQDAVLERVARLGIALALHIQIRWRPELSGAGARHSKLADASLEELMALADEAEVEAVCKMLILASEELPAPKDVNYARASLSTGHGEADLLLDNTLIEIKAGASPASIMSAEMILQLLGYALSLPPRVDAAIGGLQRVGWYLARHGVLWDFPLEEILQKLSGRQVTIAQARDEFAEFTRTHRAAL